MLREHRRTPQHLAPDRPAGGANRLPDRGAKPPLGKNGKSVDGDRGSSARDLMFARYRWQRGAARLLNWEHAVGLCQWATIRGVPGVGVALYSEGEGRRSALEGVQRCGAVWVCPVCAARISEVRRAEMNALLAWARRVGLHPVMLTLTARHGDGDSLDDLLERLKRAKKRFHQLRPWRDLDDAGTVTATEVTGGGRHGWHPHLHMIVLLPADSPEAALAAARALRGAWMTALRSAGLDGATAAFDARGASEAGAYVAKWGAAEEMTMTGGKRGRPGGGRSPLQLLAAATDEGDGRAAALWREYAAAFKGRRQLVWSRGLKDRAGINTVSDEDAAAGEAEPPPEVLREVVAVIPPRTWGEGARAARYRRGRIRAAAEDEGAAGVWRVVADGGADPRPERPPDLIE